MTNDVYKTYTVNGCTIEIVPDYDSESPEAIGDEGLYLMASHRDFFVRGKELDAVNNPEGWKELKKTHHIFQLEAYIHSGVHLALVEAKESLPDRQWDVSRLGVVCAAKKEWKSRKDAYKAAQGLVETWNDHLSGNVYGFIVRDSYGELIESIYGFSGDPEKSGVMSEAEAVAKSHVSNVDRKMLAARLIDRHMPTKAAKDLLTSLINE